MTTKLLWGILPLLTACTIDLEMQLEVGLKDFEDLENLEDLEDLEDLIEEGSDFFDIEETESDEEEDEEGMTVQDTPTTDNSSVSCDVEIIELEEVRLGEEIFAQWSLMGNPQDETVVALLQNQEVIHIDFVSMDEQEYIFPALDENGDYSVYVASGEDLHHPDCFAMQNFTIEEDNHTEIKEEVGTESETQENSCEQLDNLQWVETVQVGDTLSLEWDTSVFDEDLHVVMFNRANSIEEVEFMDLVENVGRYELFISEELEQGSYGVSLVSLSMQDCLHYGINIEQNF